ncbi:MAG TPA: prepilin-type N-terminal cleavage/methylation domain-containing protein [Gemmatimonadales bacterium]|jgi:prepilin-type N-terminal cleavage/methylation domain-containing protein|nr:prepilin-type N-terminal cleavage/methylation domain-containing protein [Gemmatimonadales bacterium]
MNRRGFSLVEMLLVMVIIGLASLIGIPRLRAVTDRANVRGARGEVMDLVSKARVVAVARGCTATFNVTTGAAAKVWVTTCKTSDVGAASAVLDTVWIVDSLANRFKVDITADVATITFDRRGLRTAPYVTSVIRAQSTTSSVIDSVQVNPVGKVLGR